MGDVMGELILANCSLEVQFPRDLGEFGNSIVARATNQVNLKF